MTELVIQTERLYNSLVFYISMYVFIYTCILYILLLPTNLGIWWDQQMDFLHREWKEAHMYNITHKEIFMDQRVRILILSQMCPELTDLPSLMSVLVYFILSACSTYPCFLTYQTAASPSNLKLRFALSVKLFFFFWFLTNPSCFLLQAYSIVAFITL